MYYQRIILYGSAEAQKTARNILQNLEVVRREEATENGAEIRLILSKRLKETSLIPLFRQSGIYGFKLVETL